MTVDPLAVAGGIDVALDVGLDAAERIDDIARRVEPAARARRIANLIDRLVMRRGRLLRRGEHELADALSDRIARWEVRLAAWDRRHDEDRRRAT